MPNQAIRHNWTPEEVTALFAKPFNDLMFQAQTVHRAHFDANEVQLSTLLSIKTGGCPEDCNYCPQSAHFDTPVKAEKLMDIAPVIEAAKRAKDAGATRFCMGAAWRSPKPRDMPKVVNMIEAVKGMGLETCMTLGMLEPAQADELSKAGLDYYNHNLDTSEEYYKEIITTRTYQDRLDTLDAVRASGMKTCCGGIVGMGESLKDRVSMLQTLANLPEHPQSVPINLLVQVDGTTLKGEKALDPLDFVRTIAVARIMMPASHVRLSAGREAMSDELQALCFMAGANSLFYGDTLLTTGNPQVEKDNALLEKLGIVSESAKKAKARAA
jgi:biotin synthase